MKRHLTEEEQWSKFYDHDLPGGQEWEGFFASVVASGKVENKLDKLARKTGRVFIEYECRGAPSGLATTDADWWAIGIESSNGDVETAILASVPWLKDTCRKYLDTKLDKRGGDNNLSKGICLPIDEFRK